MALARLSVVPAAVMMPAMHAPRPSLRRARASRPLAIAAALLLCALSLPGPVHAAGRGLSPIERRLAASVERHEGEARALLQRAVDINSGTLNLEGVRRTGALLSPEFERLGFRVRWVDGAAWGRAGHLVAERGSRG